MEMVHKVVSVLQRVMTQQSLPSSTINNSQQNVQESQNEETKVMASSSAKAPLTGHTKELVEITTDKDGVAPQYWNISILF